MKCVPLCEMTADQLWHSVREVTRKAFALGQLSRLRPHAVEPRRVELHLSMLQNELTMLRAELARRSEKPN